MVNSGIKSKAAAAMMLKMRDVIRSLGLYFFALLLFVQCTHEDYLNDSIGIFDEIESEFGCRIHYQYSSGFFPEAWLRTPIEGKGLQIESGELERMSQLIENFLKSYSKEFLRENLANIYLLKRMDFYGLSYGGTSNFLTKSIYITNNGNGNEFLTGLLHSEFSSVLFHNFSSEFRHDDWISQNPSNFQYVGSGKDLLGRDNLYGQTPELLEKGFLVNYSISSLENDFNMFIRWHFTKKNDLQELANTYPPIAEKYNLTKEFLTRINSGVDF